MKNVRQDKIIKRSKSRYMRSLEVSGGPGRGGLVGSFRVTSAISLGTA